MSKKVLLIEDEQLIVDLLENKLKQEGYDVAVARDGEAGVEMAKSVLPDIILLDIIMPKMNGFEALEQIRKDKLTAQIPVIVISNSGQPVELSRAQELGATDWLVKINFDPQEVVDKVRSQIG